MKTYWGIDLGGTKIEGIVLDESFQTLARLRLPTEQEKGYQHIVNQICKIVDLLKKETGLVPTKIGIGTPGTIIPKTEKLKNSNTLCLNGQPLRLDLERQLNLPVNISNDANCFALAETLLGIVPEKMPDAQMVFGVILGTGCGGGLVINNKIWNGRHGIGGEWGHNFLDDSGGDCYCGKVGCNERVLAGPSLERFYFEQSGTHLSLKEIVQRHRSQNDEIATLTIERLTTLFAKAISVVLNILDPDVIVLGGGVSNIEGLITEGVPKIKDFIFNDVVTTKFLKPKLGDSAGVFGAALLE